MTIDQIKRMACDCAGPEYHQTGNAACAISILLAALGSQPAADEPTDPQKDHSAELIHQPIPDMAGTEPLPQSASGYSPQESPARPKQDAQDAEEKVYHAYVAAGELRAKHPASVMAIDVVIDGLKVARRFIFDSYQIGSDNQSSDAERADAPRRSNAQK